MHNCAALESESLFKPIVSQQVEVFEIEMGLL